MYRQLKVAIDAYILSDPRLSCVSTPLAFPSQNKTETETGSQSETETLARSVTHTRRTLTHTHTLTYVSYFHQLLQFAWVSVRSCASSTLAPISGIGIGNGESEFKVNERRRRNDDD